MSTPSAPRFPREAEDMQCLRVDLWWQSRANLVGEEEPLLLLTMIMTMMGLRISVCVEDHVVLKEKRQLELELEHPRLQQTPSTSMTTTTRRCVVSPETTSCDTCLGRQVWSHLTTRPRYSTGGIARHGTG